MKLLVVEDDPVIRGSLRKMVEAWGYACPYDLLLLDLNLPGLDGMALCRRIRDRGGPQPLILMLTARDTNADRVTGLDQGADDYLVKPFDPDVLRAQVKALLRRAARPMARVLSWGDLELDRDGHGARFRDGELHLTAIEHRLLEALLRAAR